MCRPRRDQPELIPRQEYTEPSSDESDIDDEEMPETYTESENTEDTFIEESDEIEYIDVTSGEEFYTSSNDSDEDARGRLRGHVSAGRARRARHAQPPRTEFPPSLSGETFNGFTQDLVPEEITGHRIISPSEMLLSVRWLNHPETRPIELSVMRGHRPDMVLVYLQEMAARLSDNHFPSVYRVNRVYRNE